MELHSFSDVPLTQVNHQDRLVGFRARGELIGTLEGNAKALRQVQTPERLAGVVEAKLVRSAPQPPAAPTSKANLQKVLIVHGRNHAVRDKIDLYLTKELRLRTVVMEEGAHRGRTLAKKFEEMAAECVFGVYIFTADERLRDLNSEKDLTRARQNVVLEAGFMWGAIGRRGKAAFLVERDPLMDLPSDIDGVGWIPITDDLADTKMRLRMELVAAGLVPE